MSERLVDRRFSVIDPCCGRENVTPNFSSAVVKAGGFAGQFSSTAVTNVFMLGTVRGDFVGGVFREIAGSRPRLNAPTSTP